MNKLFLSSERVGETKDLQYLMQTLSHIEMEETNFSKSLNSFELWVCYFLNLAFKCVEDF